MTELFATFRKPFAEAVEALEIRLAELRPTTSSADPRYSGHDDAFMVAGAMKADLLADLRTAVRKARTEGTGYEAFVKDFRALVERNGWHGWTGEGTARGEEWRMRTIYQTNMRTSYMAGRHAQLTRGQFKFWVYRHSGAAHPRLNHLAWDGVALPPDHPFWVRHFPPNGWNCGCDVSGADTAAGIRRVGGDPDKQLPPDWNATDPRTGLPKGIAKGWGQPYSRTLDARIAEIVADKAAKLPAPIGADFGADMAEPVESAWRRWVDETLAADTGRVGFMGALSPEVIAALSRSALAPETAGVYVRPGLIRGPKAERHATAGDAFSPEQWKAAALLLRTPVAILRDIRTGNILFILEPGDRSAVLVIEMDELVRIERQSVLANQVATAYRPRTSALLERLRGGLLVFIDGNLDDLVGRLE